MSPSNIRENMSLKSDFVSGKMQGCFTISLTKKNFLMIGLKEKIKKVLTHLVDVMWQVIIHVVFLFSALMLAYTEKILHQKH